jgi:hypothetical protein
VITRQTAAAPLRNTNAFRDACQATVRLPLGPQCACNSGVTNGMEVPLSVLVRLIAAKIAKLPELLKQPQ